MNERIVGRNIRKLRIQAGLTLTVVAKKAQLTKSTLSKIETGQTSPPISTLIRIARAMNVPLVEFFIDEAKEPAYVLTRKDKGQRVIHNGSQFGYSYEALALEKRDKYVEPFLLTISPADPAGQFYHSGQEFIYMLSGCMDFAVGEDQFSLKKGDSLFFDSSHLHKTRVAGKHPAKFLCIFIQDVLTTRRKEKQK